jgi:predicted RNase H-like nuclease (RuvC/YqgF family)
MWREAANERDRLRAVASELTAQVAELRRQLEVAARDAHYMARVEQELRVHQSGGETVRVPLSRPEGRIKIGSRDWECNVIGSLHGGRSGRSLVLTVSNTAHASELLAEIRTGEVVVLSDEGRTSCTYSGRCAKIYGDAGSSDFIAMFWLDVDPGK